MPAVSTIPESGPLYEEEDAPGRRNDDELLCIGQILRKLNNLESDQARARVMAYLYSRFVDNRSKQVE